MTVAEHGVTVTIEKTLLEKVQPVRVDFVESPDGSGFQLASSLTAGGDCGSCKC